MNFDDPLLKLRDSLRVFANDRDWDQFHSPKNLATALSIESSEVLEHFQWISAEQSSDLAPDVRTRVALELADVLLYLIRLADKLDVNLLDAASQKLQINAQKYPVSKARGSPLKYTDL